MKTTLTILSLLTVVCTDLQARPSNTVWMVDYAVSVNTNKSVATDSATVAKVLDDVAAEFRMTPITPDRTDVIRIYQVHPELLIALDATSESNRIVIHTAPMTPRLKTTDAHRKFFSRLEQELGKAFESRLKKEEK